MSESESVVEGSCDPRGRVTLGSEYAGEDIVLAVMPKYDEE